MAIDVNKMIRKKNTATYKLLRAESCNEFEKKLNYYLSCGWELHGKFEIIANRNRNGELYFQLLVNRTDIPDDVLEFVSALKYNGLTFEDIKDITPKEFYECVLEYTTDNPYNLSYVDENYSTTIAIKDKKITLKHPLFYKEPERDVDDVDEEYAYDIAFGGITEDSYGY